MKIWDSEDTIVALSTPLGKGAIAIVRMSGPESLAILNHLFDHQVTSRDERRAITGHLYTPKDRHLIDQVVVIYYRAPRSYTGEDLVEISSHCNPLIIDRIIAAAIELGARLARPGEFTQRAFLNHKLDLSQAEAVASVIEAKTQQSLTHTLRQLEGGLSKRLGEIKQEMIQITSLIEVSLDFNEEEAEIYHPSELLRHTDRVLEAIDSLIGSFAYGKLLHEGIKLLILGKPNVGKSSLLNLLLKRERAIVSEIPGTTRDYIEGQLEIDGIPVQVVDTAGIRQTSDRIEEIGVQRALEQIPSADLVLALFDAHAPLDGDDQRLLDTLEQQRGQRPIVLVLNKIDLGIRPDTERKLTSLELPLVPLSAKTGQNLGELKQAVKHIILSDTAVENEEIVVTNRRHKIALENARRSLQKFREGLARGLDEVVLAAELRSALDYLGEITGETTTADILNHIFEEFCIGK